MNPAEELAMLYDPGTVTEVIRPAAIIPEDAARAILAELALHDIALGGTWQTRPSVWSRYEPAGVELIGTIQVVYSTPTRHEITIYRATVTRYGIGAGWTVESLCDDALAFGGINLAACPRADLTPPPRPFRLQP